MSFGHEAADRPCPSLARCAVLVAGPDAARLRDPRRRLPAAAPDAGRRPARRPGSRSAPRNDAEAYYVRHLLANGFGAELLRTYAMTKRFAARDRRLSRPGDDDRAGPARQRPSATGPPRADRLVDDEDRRRRPDHLDRRQPGARRAQQHGRSGVGFGGAIVDVIAPETGAAYARSAPLREGYAGVPAGGRRRSGGRRAPPTIATSCAGSASSRTCAPTTPCWPTARRSRRG